MKINTKNISEPLIDEDGKPYKINRNGMKIDLSEIPEFGGCPDGEWMTMEEFDKECEQDERNYQEYLEYKKQGKIIEEGEEDGKCYYIIEEDDEDGKTMVADKVD
jgi:hypothetical protein